MDKESKYDLDENYRIMLSDLISETLEVYRQYDYADFEEGNYSVSYKRGNDRFLEGPFPHIQEAKRGIKEHDKLRRGTKNYYSIYRENGRLKKAASYITGERDVTYFAVYRNDKRYLLPFSEEWKGRYPTYVIVAEYSESEIVREYLVMNGQIVYYGYYKLSPSEYSVEIINYVSNGKYPVLGYEEYRFSDEGGICKETRSYLWHEEYSCSAKGLPYTPELPKHLVKTQQ